MNIRYLKYSEIDKLKWDKCINQSFNGIVFAYSWYLDIVSYNWEALVFDDYKAVMPLTSIYSYGFNKIVQPNYAPQLGVFTINRLDVDIVNSFLSAIPKKFKSIHLNLNSFNKVTHNKFTIKNGIIYELDLIVPYNSLHKKFTKETKHKIKELELNKVNVTRHVNLRDLLQLKKDSSEKLLSFEHLNKLRRIIPFCINNNVGETYGAYNDKNELVAGAFFIKSHQKVTCLLHACSNEGKEIGADYAIFNNFIKENAEKNYTLNFGDYYIAEKENIGRCFNAVPVNFYKLKSKGLFSWFIK